MKLRNKKTGEIIEAESWPSTEGMFAIFFESKDGQLGSKESFESLAELNEEWEDYKPAEPLIKDEKIRNAVRAWAEANNISKCWVGANGGSVYNGSARMLMNSRQFEGLPENIAYTIAELCGEEEE